jgi:hypothetical protein
MTPTEAGRICNKYSMKVIDFTRCKETDILAEDKIKIDMID